VLQCVAVCVPSQLYSPSFVNLRVFYGHLVNLSLFIQPIYVLFYRQFILFHTIKFAFLSLLYGQFSIELTLQNF